MSSIDPDLKLQLMSTLRRCDAFTSNAALRAVFVDGRLSPWAYNVPEGESTASRVQATIALLHNRTNMQGQNALVLLLYVLQDHYDPNDAYYGELGSLIAQLSNTSSAPPANTTTFTDGRMDHEAGLPDFYDPEYKIKLVDLLTRHFNLDELKVLCLSININHEDLSSGSLSGKALDLVRYCERHTCMPALVKSGKMLRPELDWS